MPHFGTCEVGTAWRTLPSRLALTLELLQSLHFHQHCRCSVVFVLSFPDVVAKYSNFVSFPLYLNGRRKNTLQVGLSSSTGCSAMETKLYVSGQRGRDEPGGCGPESQGKLLCGDETWVWG